MKKFVIFTLIIAMAAGAAFAQTANGISVNAWGRGVFAPLMVKTAPLEGGETKIKSKEMVNMGGDGKWYFDEDTGLAVQNPIPDWQEVEVERVLPDYATNYAGAGVTWGGTKVRTDFRVNGNADFIGFVINLTEDGVDAGDNAFIWAKPFSNDVLKLSVGKFDVDDLRGKVNTDTGFEDFAVPAKMDEDAIFNRFRAGNGFMLSSQPVDGLFLGLRVNGDLFKGWGGDGSGTLLLDAYRFLQVGFGYDIADVGQIRAQWLGGWFGTIDPKTLGDDMGKEKYGVSYFSYPDWYDPATAGWTMNLDNENIVWNQARIEAAFALTAVQNLLVDLGLKFWLPIEVKERLQFSKGIDVNVGAKFRADAFQIVGQVGANLGGYYRAYDGKEFSKQANGIGLNVNLIPSYDLDAFTIGADIGMQMKGVSKDGKGEALKDDFKDDPMALGFGGFVSKGLGSGSVKAGLAFKTAPTTNGKANGSGVFTIPVILEYAFF